MKYSKLGILTAAVLGVSQFACADALLIDAYDGANNRGADPSSYTAWGNAGVTEDVSAGALGTISSNGNVYNIDGGMTFSGTAGSWGSTLWADNNMLNDYWNVNSGTESVSIGGLDNTLTTADGFAGAGGNTFALQANQDYKLYLFGAGDTDGQDTTFTFDSVSKTTSSVVPGAEDSHYVTYEFTTGADITGYSLDFSFSNNTSDWGSFNGLALVAVPEPATLGLIGAAGGALLFIRRRFMI